MLFHLNRVGKNYNHNKMYFRFTSSCLLILVYAELISSQQYDLVKFKALIFTQDLRFRVEFGIFGKLIRQWFSQAHIRPRPLIRQISPAHFADIEAVSQVSITNCKNVLQLKRRLELETEFGPQYLNLYRWLRFMNQLQFNMCIWSFDDELQEFWQNLEEVSQDFIDDVYESATELSYESEISLIEATRYVREGEEPSLIDDPKFHQGRRWLSMSAALLIHETNGPQIHDQLELSPRVHLRKLFDKLLDDTCGVFPRGMSKENIDLFDQVRNKYQIERNPRWEKLKAVCTVLAHEPDQDFELVFTYYMNHLESRELIKQGDDEYDSLYKRVFERLDTPITDNDADLISLAKMDLERLLASRPIQTKKLLQRWIGSDRFVDLFSTMRLFKDNMISLDSMSNIEANKCNVNSLNQRIALEYRYIFSKPYINVHRYLQSMTLAQIQLCERQLSSHLNELLKKLDVSNMIQLESLRRLLLGSMQQNHDPKTYISIASGALMDALTIYLFLQDVLQQGAIMNPSSENLRNILNDRHLRLSVRNFQFKICQSFREEFSRLEISDLRSLIGNRNHHYIKLRERLGYMTRILLTYDQVCKQIERPDFTQIKSSEAIFTQMKSNQPTLNQILRFLRGDTNKFNNQYV